MSFKLLNDYYFNDFFNTSNHFIAYSFKRSLILFYMVIKHLPVVLIILRGIKKYANYRDSLLILLSISTRFDIILKQTYVNFRHFSNRLYVV